MTQRDFVRRLLELDATKERTRCKIKCLSQLPSQGENCRISAIFLAMEPLAARPIIAIGIADEIVNRLVDRESGTREKAVGRCIR